MAEENVELAMRVYDAFNRRDLDEFLALTHDKAVIESRLVAMEGGYRGLDGARRWWDNLLDFLPDYHLEVEEVRPLGDFTLGHLHARASGAASATPLVETIWQAVRWQDGRYVWWRNFNTESEALEAIDQA